MYKYSSFLDSIWRKQPRKNYYNIAFSDAIRGEPSFGECLIIGKKTRHALTCFSSESNTNSAVLVLYSDIEIEFNSLELGLDIEVESHGLELGLDIEVESHGLELGLDIEVESHGLELSSDIKQKSVEFFLEPQIFSAGNNIDVTLKASSQVSGIDTLTKLFTVQSEADMQPASSSIDLLFDSFSHDLNTDRLFASLSRLIDESVGNRAHSQAIFTALGGFDSLIKKIDIQPACLLLDIQNLDNLDGLFDKPDNLLAWNSLALDFATASSSGPTPCSRFFAYLGNSLWDAWAVFEDKAIGSIYQQEKQEDFIALLEGFEISSIDLAEFKYLYQSSGNSVREILESAIRQVVMDVSAFNVFSAIQSSLFKDGIPDALVGTAQKLLDNNLTDISKLGKKIANLVVSIGTNIGESISSSINQYALKDGSNQAGFYQDTTDYQPSQSVFIPGDPNSKIDSFWQPLEGQNPLTPHWGEVIPFAINTNDLIPTDIVKPYTDQGDLNSTFISQLIEVRDIGINLTPLEKAIAEYYEGGDGTAFPPGLWLDHTIDLSLSRNLNLDESLKVTFGVSQSMYDAGIATWATKYKYDSVRPITAIRQYEPDTRLSDGTLASGWAPFLPTPPFPDTPSGHSSFSSAANYFLIDFFGSNQFDFSVTLKDDDSQYSANGFDGIPGSGEDLVISSTYFSEASAQAGMSRIYGGIHQKDGDLKGQVIGNKVGLVNSQKINSLEKGLLPENGDPLSVQIFGTMDSDILTGLPADDVSSSKIQQLYAFGGKDIITVRGGSQWQVYGGSGIDTFRFYETESLMLRDYQAMERIELNSEIFQLGETIEDIQFAVSSIEPFTDVSLNGRTLFIMDGSWGLDDVNLSTFA